MYDPPFDFHNPMHQTYALKTRMQENAQIMLGVAFKPMVQTSYTDYTGCMYAQPQPTWPGSGTAVRESGEFGSGSPMWNHGPGGQVIQVGRQLHETTYHFPSAMRTHTHTKRVATATGRNHDTAAYRRAGDALQRSEIKGCRCEGQGILILGSKGYLIKDSPLYRSCKALILCPQERRHEKKEEDMLAFWDVYTQMACNLGNAQELLALKCQPAASRLVEKNGKESSSASEHLRHKLKFARDFL
eukprot:637173-Pelagomonas_calceolata.AAC.2